MRIESPILRRKVIVSNSQWYPKQSLVSRNVCNQPSLNNEVVSVGRGGTEMIVRILALLISLTVFVSSGTLIVVLGQGRQMGGVGITVGTNFSGRCITLTSSNSDLRRSNLPTRFRSLRPLVRQPR